MAEKRSSGNMVTFQRGGREVRLHKSPHLIAVRFRSGAVPQNLTGPEGRELDRLRGRASLRFVRRVPGRRVALFRCRSARDRSDVMDELRAHKSIQYVSHVLQRSADDDGGSEIGVDDRVFVEFGGKPSRRRVKSVEREHGLRAIWQFPEMPGGVVFQVTSDAKENPMKIANRLHHSRACRTAEPCLVEAKAARAVPSDPSFRRQWHLLNTGQGGGTPGADCNAPAAWDYTWGDPKITIAIIDDGFDLQHPDLRGADKVRHPYDATERDNNPSPGAFSDNHGTACAGVAIASRGGDGLTVGTAPDCSWMPIRHAGEMGDFEEALAFYHAYRNGADVISCSWGPPDNAYNEFWPMPSITRYVIDLCVKRGRGGKGIPVLFAAGNGNEPLALDGYANYKNVIAVAASTNQDEKAWYSDYGKNVWVCAPSNGGTLGVYTTDRTGYRGYSSDSDYVADFGGTSSSTPLVAGVVGLMLAVNPKLTVSKIKSILKRTAVKIGIEQAYEYEDHWGDWYSDEYDSRGHSQVFGWGCVDAGAAVAAARNA